MINIYCLQDPDTGLVYYVGRTIRPLKNRLSQHVRVAVMGENTPKSSWIRGMIYDDKKPSITMIEQCPSEQGKEREIHWIQHYSSLNAGLFNYRLRIKEKPIKIAQAFDEDSPACGQGMRWRLKELQGEYQQRTGERLTYEQITAATGISSSTLSEIATGRQGRTDLRTIDRLLTLFADKLGRPLTTGDLLQWTPHGQPTGGDK